MAMAAAMGNADPCMRVIPLGVVSNEWRGSGWGSVVTLVKECWVGAAQGGIFWNELILLDYTIK